MAQRSSSNNPTTDKTKNVKHAAVCNFCHMKCSEKKEKGESEFNSRIQKVR